MDIVEGREAVEMLHDFLDIVKTMNIKDYDIEHNCSARIGSEVISDIVIRIRAATNRNIIPIKRGDK